MAIYITRNSSRDIKMLHGILQSFSQFKTPTRTRVARCYARFTKFFPSLEIRVQFTANSIRRFAEIFPEFGIEWRGRAVIRHSYHEIPRRNPDRNECDRKVKSSGLLISHRSSDRGRCSKEIRSSSFRAGTL